MNTAFWIVVTVGVIGLVFLIWAHIRDNRTSKFRIRMIHEDYDLYKKLPPYGKMMWSFKPLKKFVEEAKSK